MVKSKFRRKKVAQKTLALAVGSAVSVDKFRNTILDCVHEGCTKTIKRMAAAVSADNLRRTNKHAARGENASLFTTCVSSDDQRVTVNCKNPKCGRAGDEAKFLYCPCHTVCYVSTTTAFFKAEYRVYNKDVFFASNSYCLLLLLLQCQKDCQRADWKELKKVCPKQVRSSS
jgi:hypothetical protein